MTIRRRPSPPTRQGWSADRGVWTKLDGLTTHLQWRCVPTDRRVARSLPAAPGVYFFHGGPPGLSFARLRYVLYVGETTNLRRRFAHWLDPIRRPAANGLLDQYIRCYYPAIRYCYAQVPDERIRRRAENLLFRAFHPPCNRVVPTLKVRLRNPVPLATRRLAAREVPAP